MNRTGQMIDRSISGIYKATYDASQATSCMYIAVGIIKMSSCESERERGNPMQHIQVNYQQYDCQQKQRGLYLIIRTYYDLWINGSNNGKIAELKSYCSTHKSRSKIYSLLTKYIIFVLALITLQRLLSYQGGINNVIIYGVIMLLLCMLPIFLFFELKVNFLKYVFIKKYVFQLTYLLLNILVIAAILYVGNNLGTANKLLVYTVLYYLIHYFMRSMYIARYFVFYQNLDDDKIDKLLKKDFWINFVIHNATVFLFVLMLVLASI